MAERHHHDVPRLDPRAVGNHQVTKAIDLPAKVERNPKNLVVPEAMVEEIPMAIQEGGPIFSLAMKMDSGFHDDACDIF